LEHNQVRLLFLFSFKAITYAVDMTNWRQGREFILRALPGIHLHDRIVRLWDLEFDDEVVEVLEASLHVNMTASSAVSSPAFVAAAVAPGAGSQPASAASAPAVVSQPVSAASASAALGLGGLARLSVSALRPITAELRQPAKTRKRTRSGEQVQDEPASDVEDSEEEAAVVSSASSCASVDTDVDSAVDECAEGSVGDKLARGQVGRGGHTDGRQDARQSSHQAEPNSDDDVDLASSESGDDSDLVSDEDSDSKPDSDLKDKRFRHPTGTWNIWNGTWFYITKTPGWLDVKARMKEPFRNCGDGMGRSSMSKTLTPLHYGDVWEDPWRSLFLLRAWTIWRARWMGWARQKECRLREVNRQVERFVVNIREAHTIHDIPLQKPLLGNVAAHGLLVKWTPDVVLQLVPAV
jgi:hypothetical protein